MLAFARALMTRPRLMVLDEPTAALAPALVAEAFARIRGLPALGAAVLLIEQRARQALAISDRGAILDNLYKKYVRSAIVEPTFIIDHPTEILPLAKRKPGDPRYVESFQVVLGKSVELCKAFTELNDPIDQRKRFEEQERLREGGDEEAQKMDTDFIEALETGMPPTAGFGMGIDRLAAVLTGSHSLKEVILFPTMRPEHGEGSEE